MISEFWKGYYIKEYLDSKDESKLGIFLKDRRGNLRKLHGGWKLTEMTEVKEFIEHVVIPGI